MNCPACGSEAAEGAKFCVECGAALLLQCPACSAPHAPGQKFCAECGARLDAPGAGSEPPAGEPEQAEASLPDDVTSPEMRLVSVLFVDLVGFTTLSEGLEAEDVREMLGHYFEVARTIVRRYGGELGKFIGDAVMAVWGAPLAREDDAERAVRAGLELVDAVQSLGEKLELPGLQARAGVTTGRVAAMARAGEGLVTGDRVNTAARVQTLATPGTLSVDRVTHDVTSAAIAYEDTGEHAAKGKSEPLHLFRAVRVVAGVGGAEREPAYEAPLIGRDSDLRALKELFHGALERRTARLVAVSGTAGVGKTRLRSEFDRYVDGIAETILWHSGRCLPYGDGVAYWALGEMVRQRLGIPQDATPEVAAHKLSAGLERWIPATAEQEFLAPRLGALLGTAAPELGRTELFAGWRMFFERLAEHAPVVMVFEDLQWADEGMLDFIEHVLDWSAASPIFMLTLARHDFANGREGWPSARRGATVLELDPLSETALGALLDALVRELPAPARTRIIERAEGVPLFAIETIRALANSGVLVAGDGRLSPARDVGDLEVPASLGSLLAARIDALEPNERSLIKAISVLGGGFPRSAVEALTELPADEVEGLLNALIRKQVLVIRSDPLSPDRGQYAFAQTLLRSVAYEMLSRRERKARHLAAAEHLAVAFANDGEEMAEAIASHYVEAYRAAQRDEDAPALRRRAADALRRAAERAGTVGAPEVAERTYRMAAELAEDDRQRSRDTRKAGEMALQAGRLEEAVELLDTAIRYDLEAGLEHDAARAARPLGRALSRLGRNEEAIERITPALDALGPDTPDPEVAALHAALGHTLLFAGHDEDAGGPLESALQMAQELDLPGVLSGALIDKGLICLQASRPEEARALFAAGQEIAERNDLPAELALARGNSGNLAVQWDLPGAEEHYSATLALARRSGDRFRESVAAGNLMYLYLLLGRWPELDELGAELLDDLEDRPGADFLRSPLVVVHTLRGAVSHARETLEKMAAWQQGDDDELRAIHGSLEIRLQLADGRPEQALERGRELVASAIEVLGASHDAVRNAWPDTLDAAIALGRRDDALELIALLSARPPGHVPPYLRAQLARGRALAGSEEGSAETVARDFTDAIDQLQMLGYPYWAARTQADLAAWLAARGDSSAQEQGEEAGRTLQRLGAVPGPTVGEDIAGAPLPDQQLPARARAS
ncbi:MAG TPA: adenylate/guanylate cyclase domain-containing protein [Solirubrobacteraceae bacterium]|nr:adenylate/guanylate cyclase domain-containing protein [Solirubrobacteraceae bacterium]